MLSRSPRPPQVIGRSPRPSHLNGSQEAPLRSSVVEKKPLEIEELPQATIAQNPRKAYMLALLDSIVFGFGNHYASSLARRKNGSLGLFC